MLAALALAELIGNQGEPVARVGPFAIGQTAADVRRAAGPGRASQDCRGRAAADGCERLLRYTDGSAVVVLRFPPHGTVLSIEADFAASPGRAQRLPRRLGTIASWQWDGGPIGTFPPPDVRGWGRAGYTAGRGCTADFEIPDISVEIACSAGSARPSQFLVTEH